MKYQRLKVQDAVCSG